MKVTKQHAGYYEVKSMTRHCGVWQKRTWIVLRNPELEGRDKWIAYDVNDPYVVFDPMPTKASIIQALANEENRWAATLLN